MAGRGAAFSAHAVLSRSRLLFAKPRAEKLQNTLPRFLPLRRVVALATRLEEAMTGVGVDLVGKGLPSRLHLGSYIRQAGVDPLVVFPVDAEHRGLDPFDGGGV